MGHESERVMAIMKRGCKYSYYDTFWKWKDDYVTVLRWGSREVTDLMMWRYGKMTVLMMEG